MEWIETEHYQLWLQKHKIDQTVSPVSELDGPLISVVMPVYNTPLDYLAEAIDSLLAQTYPQWELCVTNDASSADGIREMLDQYAARDARISVLHSEKQGGIAVATNYALERCRGEYVAFLDHDDCLTPDALAEVVDIVSHHDNAGLIYSDSDILDESGQRCNPYFKPDWYYLLFLSQNYLNHLSVYRRDLIEQLGGLRTGFDGSQDYDLALRVVERLQSEEILHIPKILYHWRRRADSVARSNIKVAVTRARQAIKDHLLRTGMDARVEAAQNKVIFNKIRPVIPADKVKVLVVGWGSESAVNLGSYSCQDVDVEVIAAREASASLRQGEYDAVDCQLSPAQLRNSAVRHRDEDYFIFVNSACEPMTANWVQSLVSLLQFPGVAVAGARILTSEDHPLFFGVVLERVKKYTELVVLRGFGAPLKADYFGRSFLDQQVIACGGGVLAVKREVFTALSGFDETLTSELGADTDLCLRAQNCHGYSAVSAEVIFRRHDIGIDSETVQQENSLDDLALLFEKHQLASYPDPQSNPNLDMGSGFPGLIRS